MSNIYEALEQACRQRTIYDVMPEASLQTEIVQGISLNGEMVYLHHQVDHLFSNYSPRLLQFLGARRGEGVSTIVREFAKVAVERHGKSVLVLDSAYQDPTRKININFTCEYGWLDLFEEGELIDKAFSRIGNTSLYFAPISVQASLAPSMKDLSMTVNLWAKLRERFDLILIDSSSDANISESISISPHVDGVILVIEAEKTRRKIVEKLKKQIIANGGTIIGIVLNKRRYYIPEFLYKML